MGEPKTFGNETKHKKKHKFYAEYAFLFNFSIQFTEKACDLCSAFAMKNKIHNKGKCKIHTHTQFNARLLRVFSRSTFNLDADGKIAAFLQPFLVPYC